MFDEKITKILKSERNRLIITSIIVVVLSFIIVPDGERIKVIEILTAINLIWASFSLVGRLLFNAALEKAWDEGYNTAMAESSMYESDYDDGSEEEDEECDDEEDEDIEVTSSNFKQMVESVKDLDLPGQLAGTNKK